VNHLPGSHDKDRIVAFKEQAKTLWATGDKDGAIRASNEALDEAIRLDDKPEIAGLLRTIGKMQISMGDGLAAGNLQRSAQVYRELGDNHRLATSLGLLGRALLRAGDIDGGEQAINESVKIALQLRDHWQVAYGLALMAEVAVAHKDYHRAALLWAASEANYDGYDNMLDDYDRRAADLQQDRVRRVLGEMEFEQMWAKGMQLLPREAIASASNADLPAKELNPEWNDAANLTPLEIEVLRLITQRLSDVEIAERLSLSVDTVSETINDIYVKLDVHSRLSARRYALSNGIA
jgi:DNA-binding NarL/FixJ family response regulator